MSLSLKIQRISTSLVVQWLDSPLQGQGAPGLILVREWSPTSQAVQAKKQKQKKH